MDNYLSRNEIKEKLLIDGKSTHKYRIEAEYLFNKKDYTKAFEYYELLHTFEKTADSAFSLASMYMNGYGIVKDEYKAFSLIEESAQLGSDKAMFVLSGLYRFGIGTYKDNDEACKWEDNAIMMNNPDALYARGQRYMQLGGKDEEAFNLVKKSAKLGFAPSYLLLGFWYLHGEGTKQKIKKSIKWLEKSAYMYDLSSVNLLMSLYEELEDYDKMDYWEDYRIKATKKFGDVPIRLITIDN